MVKEIDSIIIDGKFLDEHYMGELEKKIWVWCEELGYPQGELEENRIYLKIILVKEE